MPQDGPDQNSAFEAKFKAIIETLRSAQEAGPGQRLEEIGHTLRGAQLRDLVREAFSSFSDLVIAGFESTYKDLLPKKNKKRDGRCVLDGYTVPRPWKNPSLADVANFEREFTESYKQAKELMVKCELLTKTQQPDWLRKFAGTTRIHQVHKAISSWREDLISLDKELGRFLVELSLIDRGSAIASSSTPQRNARSRSPGSSHGPRSRASSAGSSSSHGPRSRASSVGSDPARVTAKSRRA